MALSLTKGRQPGGWLLGSQNLFATRAACLHGCGACVSGRRKAAIRSPMVQARLHAAASVVTSGSDAS